MKIIKYGFVSCAAAAVDMGTLYLLSPVLGFSYLGATAAAFIAGIVVNYLLSTRYVFGASRGEDIKTPREFTAYALIGVTGLALSLLFMRIFVGFAGLPVMAAKVITTGLVFFWNYFGRRAFYERGGTICRK